MARHIKTGIPIQNHVLRFSMNLMRAEMNGAASILNLGSFIKSPEGIFNKIWKDGINVIEMINAKVAAKLPTMPKSIIGFMVFIIREPKPITVVKLEKKHGMNIITKAS
jgi:hypothetical protein